MPRPRGKQPPKYGCHKASGQAVVRIHNKDHYLGPHGSPESHEAYARLISEWRLAETESIKSERQTNQHQCDLTITELVSLYRDFATEYYSKDGVPTKELAEMKLALRPLRQLYGRTLAADFGPLKLKAVRQHLVDSDQLSRGVINARVKRIKRFFKWAVSEELVPPSIIQGLSTVSGLRRGRTTAREAPPVRPVADVWVDLVVPALSPPVAAMVQIQRLTGMRPGEVVLMRACDIDTGGDVWIYQPHAHKSEWREQSRIVPLGPQAQEIVRDFLSVDLEAYLFSPAKSEEWRNAQRGIHRSAERKTKIYPCELKARDRRKAKAKRRPRKRKPRDRYDVDSYRRAITYAIDRLNKQRTSDNLALIPKWYPLQLRHSRATEIRKSYGIEAAQVSLGHRHADVTQIYAERNLELAIQIAKKTG
ncbi:site-specific integrase [Bremerella sp. JC770]|uniref:site-specific integrase n=1 Tax=Bremerella sp. JC770 TaxID=3232137 RepID=UPI00345A5808